MYIQHESAEPAILVQYNTIIITLQLTVITIYLGSKDLY